MRDTVDTIKDKRVLFITTKNIDYIRNTQEVRIIKENAQSIYMIFSRNKYYFFRIISVWLQICKVNISAYDVVFVGFAPQLILPFFKKKFSEKYTIIDFFISVYDTLVCDRKTISEGGVLSRICRWLDKTTLNLANHVLTDTKAHAEYFINEFCNEKNKYETMYLEGDLSIYYPRSQNKPDEIKNQYVVLYFGSILPLQGVDVVLDAVRRLDESTGILFDIIGPIPSKYNKPIQSNVRYTEWLSQDKLAERIANADLCLAGHFCNNIDKAKRTIPGKAYIYEMMDKCMVLGDGKANHEIFKNDDRHFYCPMGNATALAEMILQVKNETVNNNCDTTL